MNSTFQAAQQYIEQNIEAAFHDKKIKKITGLTLEDVLRRKNPYLYKAKNCLLVSEYVSAVLDATLSSGEETQFGNFLEQVAVFVCQHALKGRKSSAKGIDLEFETIDVKYLVAIKSGPNWANASQLKKMQSDFQSARKTLATSGGAKGMNFTFIEGCCYGRDDNPEKGTHRKLCGERFWEFISNGDANLYQKIIVPLSYKAKEKSEEVANLISAKKNLFEKEFLNNFCDTSGQIDWNALLKYNSGRKSGEL